MQRNCLFITGSQFEGTYRMSTNTMDGFGRYTYPDGSEYLGFFRNSRFHGYGRLKLAAPYSFTFKGEFNDGHLVAIEDMNFSDGLKFRADVTEDKVDPTPWRYCSAVDRRYASELYWGVEPVGPSALVTKWHRPRPMESRNYDLEEGVYGASTGFVTMRPPPLAPLRFVGSPKEREWIMKNCRRADRHPVQEPDPEIGRRIIDLNLRLRKPGVTGADKPQVVVSEMARSHRHDCEGIGQPSTHLLQLTEPHERPGFSSDPPNDAKWPPREDCELISDPTPPSDRMRSLSTHSRTTFSEPSLVLPADKVVNCKEQGFDRLKSYEMDMRTSILTTFRVSSDKRNVMMMT